MLSLLLWAAVEAASGQVRIDVTRPAMGTTFRIVACADDSVAGRAAVDAAFARIAEMERVLSDYDPASEVSRFAQQPVGRPVEVSDDLASALAIAGSWWSRTGGAFDPALGALTRLWRRAIRRNETPPEGELQQARAASGWTLIDRSRDGRRAVRLHEGVRLDFGGIGKGLAADQALERLASLGVTQAVVDAGGDVTAAAPPSGRTGWRVEGPGGAAWLVANGSIATSGATYRHVDADTVRYSHIIDPRSGRGVTGRRIVTVSAGRGADADALASAFSVLQLEEAVRVARREGVGLRIEEEGQLIVAGSWPPSASSAASTTDCRAPSR